ncbi:quaternary ammonium compound-resistance protein SugE [Prauserella shujinwangii]|uniref:Quaternary ammonium compound-resistance protein SugE n=1 Tax=Prauserella shujinwangii TaxID=1453103 RepID=A0A2T0LMK2_9PSEU|nr:multidrug efflux SMR transporter [Prauserella shujinwangii]PRX44308.1 quaternary ammonium compound-resistance protein SugE [Prauserella shujinwangii]
MAWLILILAALLELVWAFALKQADGFTRFWPSVTGLVVATISVVLLTLALRDLPVGTAYAVWVGLGAFGVAAMGIIALGESASAARLGCLALIVAGVVGLRLADG